MAEPEKLSRVTQRKPSSDERPGGAAQRRLGLTFGLAGPASGRRDWLNHSADLVGEPDIEVQARA